MDPDAISLHAGAEKEDAAEVPQGQVSFSYSGANKNIIKLTGLNTQVMGTPCSG